MHNPFASTANDVEIDVFGRDSTGNERLLITRSSKDGDTGVVNQSSVFSSVVNLTNSIVGSGILGLPFAFAAAGWVLGYLFLAMASCATIFSLHILSQCCTRVKAPATFYR
jgi:hypothetical protein